MTPAPSPVRKGQRISAGVFNRLIAAIRELQDMVARLGRPRRRLAKTGGSAITGRSGATCSTGTVTVWTRVGATLSATTETRTVFNPWLSSVPANTMCEIATGDDGRDEITGWDCS
jgi:hypothetical protein